MLRNAEDEFGFHKIAQIRGVLLKPDPEAAGQEVQDFVHNKPGKLGELDEATKLWWKWTTRFFHATHSLLVIGFLSIAVFIVCRTLTR